MIQSKSFVLSKTDVGQSKTALPKDSQPKSALQKPVAAPPKIILGIDPGTQIMGYGAVELQGKKIKFLAMGVLDLRKEKDHFTKIKKIIEQIGFIIEEIKPDELAIESPFFGKNVQSMLKLGRAQGAAIAAALIKNIPIFEYAPRKVKMSITGRGSASKEQLSLMLSKTIENLPDTVHFDATDALGVALCHAYEISRPIASGGKGANTWEKFVKENQVRIKPSK